MLTTEGGQQVLVLREGTTQSRGRRAQNNNITAVELIANIVKTSLGPRGMDKMLVDSTGDVTITNDGATMLRDMDIQHPAAKMIVEITKAVDNEVGDGTTSAVVLAGALLQNAEKLLEMGVHPMVIVSGYRKAADQAQIILDKVSIPVEAEDRITLTKVARTSMASKLVSNQSPFLGALVVDAVLQVVEKRESGDLKVDIDNVKVEKKVGGSVSDTTLVRGVILDKEVTHPGMPKRVEKARIALINSPLEIEKTEFDAKINISDPSQIQRFLDEETEMLKDMVENVLKSGANVLVCQKGIDDLAQHYLAKAGILCIKRAKESDMAKLAKATGARVVVGLNNISIEDVGEAGLVEERKIGEGRWTFVEKCRNPKAVTIFIRGGSQRVIDEAERSIHDAIMVVKDVIEMPRIVGGGGAVEVELSHHLLKWANTMQGREQLAAQKFAEAMESIPLALAVNAGFDPIDVQVELHEKHSGDGMWYGVDVLGKGVRDMLQKDIIEPLSVKEQVIKSATECTCMLLRIDDVIASGRRSPPMPRGMPPGMSGTE
jgi:thermosome